MVRFEAVTADTRNGLYKHGDFYGRGTRILKMFNLRDGGLNMERVDEVELDDAEAAAFALKPGDILMNRVNSPELVGKCAVIPQGFGPAVFESKNIRIRVRRELAEPTFFARYFSSPAGRPSLTRGVKHAIGMATLNSSDLRSCVVPVPPVSEQQRIVELLEQADALRCQRAAADALAARILPVLFRQMFGDPGANQKRWPVQPLSDFIEFLTSGSRGWAKHYRATGDMFLRIQNIGRNELLLDDITFVEAPADAEAARTRVKPGDLLLSITADLGRTAVIPDSFPTAYINQHLALLRLRGISPFYVSALLSSNEMKQRWAMIGRDAVKLGLNFDDIRTFRFPVPKPELQSEFEARLATVNEIRREQRKTRTNIETLFQAMVHRAFTGELTARWREAHMKELLAEMELQSKALGESV